MTDKITAFKALHIPGDPLMLFNIWDAGSAKAVAGAGAKAIATGSYGVAEAQGFNPHQQSPMPLAMFNSGCFCRAWACNALDTQQRPYRLAYTSPSLSAIMAVVGAGLAVTAQLRSLITPDLRILGNHEGLPELPNCSIVLLRNPRSQSAVSEALAEHIVEGFKL